MEYFTIHKKDNEIYIHFFNRRWSIDSSGNSHSLFRDLDIDLTEFVKKTNEIFRKYEILIPNDYPKESTIQKKIEGKKVDDFPIRDFLLCIYCCIVIEEEYGMNTSKVIRWDLIKPNSNAGIHHACSMTVITLNYLRAGLKVTIPHEQENEYNPDIIINNLKCEVKTIQEKDWSKEIDPETGFGKRKPRGPDLCYDIGTFIAKEKSGYKGILQGDVVFADLTLKSLGDICKDLRGFGFDDRLEYGLPELKKCRIIFFARFDLECVAYYIDFEPRLWNLIDIATGFEYQPATFSFSVPNDGKFHKINLPSPPKEND